MAERLGCTEKTVRTRAARGLLPYRKWAGRIIFDVAEVEEFLRKLPGVTVEEALQNLEERQA